LTPFPDKVEIWSDQDTIGISNIVANYVELRSLSNMGSPRSGVVIPPTAFSSEYPNIHLRDELCYRLAEGKIDILVRSGGGDGDSVASRLLHSLQGPVNITKLDVSKDKKIMVAYDEGGFLHKLELKKNKGLNEIIGEMDAD